jgi:hypothetical protein
MQIPKECHFYKLNYENLIKYKSGVGIDSRSLIYILISTFKLPLKTVLVYYELCEYDKSINCYVIFNFRECLYLVSGRRNYFSDCEGSDYDFNEETGE